MQCAFSPTLLANRRTFFSDMAEATEMAGTIPRLIGHDSLSWIHNNLGHHVGDPTLTALANSPVRAVASRYHNRSFQRTRIRRLVT